MSAINLSVESIAYAADHTYYLKFREPAGQGASGSEVELPEAVKEQMNRHYIESEFRLSDSKGNEVNGRGYMCRCYDGELWSLTLRSKGGPVLSKDDWEQRTSRDWTDFITNSATFEKKRALSPYKASSRNSPGSGYLNSFDEVVQALRACLGETGKASSGLLIVSGDTGCGKSAIVRGLVYEYLSCNYKEFVERKKRPPHILTLEDPVEESFYDGKGLPNLPKQGQEVFGVDFTPRRRSTDVNSVEDFFSGALRQTPMITYVGETRRDRDWKAILRFAGTGHFVVTTTHATSLAETFELLLMGPDGTTPSWRRYVADRLVAVCHLKQYPELLPAVTATLPSFWVASTTNKHALINDGLASLISTGNPTRGVQGRKRSFEELGKSVKDSNRAGAFRRLVQDDLNGQ